MWKVFACAAVISACAPMPGPKVGRADQAELGGSVSVVDFGAVPDDGLDDRAAIQAALNSGASEVVVPIGVFDVAHGAGFYDVIVPAGVTLRGVDRDGSVLRQTCGQPGSTRLVHIAASNVTISTLTLDGQDVLLSDGSSCQTVDEHRSGTFVQAPTGVSIWGVQIEHVTAMHFTGDGLYAYVAGDPADPTNPAHLGVAFHDVEARNNHRNGLTLGGLIYSALVDGSRLHDNRVQQLDSETGAGGFLNNVTIDGNTIDGTASNDYALTISGGSSSSHSHNWHVRNNVIIGGINTVWADDVTIDGNAITDATTKPAITLWRDNNRVAVQSNTITLASSAINDSAIYVAGTGVGSISDAVTIAGNMITATGSGKAWGVRAEGAGRVAITNNTLVGPVGAVSGYAAIALRATIVGQDFVSVLVHDNNVSNWGLGLSAAGNGAAKLLAVEVSSNVFDDTAGTQLAALSPDSDGAHAIKDLKVGGNTLSGGCTALYTGRAMTGVLGAWGDHWVVP